MLNILLINLFHIDVLAKIMIALVVFIGAIVGIFAKQYMQGDSRYRRFFILYGLLLLSVILMVISDHIILLLSAWAVSNLLLVKLMIHNPNWPAAKNSGYLTAKTLSFGFVCLVISCGLFYYCTGETSIQNILRLLDTNSPVVIIAMLLMLVAAMAQSAIWPFHRWLISSLNSPTPVSAIMHAGLVNGGGFLLARFSTIYVSNHAILNFIFLFGLGTALIGTLWKLIQSDVKRMLACSTMGQMGFMFVQCGLGLFPAAIAHLCWHGLFKANLFLSSSSAVEENRLSKDYSPDMSSFFLALFCGILGSYMFAFANHQQWLTFNTTFVLIGLSFVATTQFALILIQRLSWKQFPIIILLTVFVSSMYGFSVWLIGLMLAPMHIMQPQPLNAFHIIGLISLVLVWLVMLFKDKWLSELNMPRALLMFYVKALNASQPHPATITAHRNQYRYK